MTPPTKIAHRSADQVDRSGESVAWLSRGERGALVGIRVLLKLVTVFGRWPARQILRVVSFYYVLFDRELRAVSRDWLRRVLDHPPRFRDIYRHVFIFAQVSLDRILHLSGRSGQFTVERSGHKLLEAAVDEERGAILLGAHLGSFEAMRAGAVREELPLSIVGNFSNAAMANAVLSELNPALAKRVIHVGDDAFGFALKVRERIEAGDLVAFLGDRTKPGGRTVRVPFMGEVAEFPAGPFLLAASMRCPIYLVFGLYEEPKRYRLFCEPFADAIILPRGRRVEALEEYVGRYAARLEHFARLAPFNWFNFFDFWSNSADE